MHRDLCSHAMSMNFVNSSSASDLGIDNYGLFVGLGYQVFIENLHRTLFSVSSKNVLGISVVPTNFQFFMHRQSSIFFIFYFKFFLVFYCKYSNFYCSYNPSPFWSQTLLIALYHWGSLVTLELISLIPVELI